MTPVPRTRHAAALTIGTVSVVVIGLMGGPAAAASDGHVKSAYARIAVLSRAPLGAVELGATSTTKHISGLVALAPRNPGALQAAAEAVSDPHSARFHRFLGAGEFAEAYGPTAATIDAVSSTLTASHLVVTSVSGNGLLVHFSGSVGAAESAFRTHLADFRLASGRVGTDTTTALSFPASIAPAVVSVVGLDTVTRRSASVERGTHPAARRPITSAFTHYPAGPKACAGAARAAAQVGGLTDDQVAHAYGVDGLYKGGDTGVGQTVGIFELEPFALSDIKGFDTCYFGASKAAAMTGRVQTTIVDGGSGVGPGSGESLLDIEDVQGLAPGATVNVYEAPLSESGSLDNYNQMVQDDPDVISNSWGECEPDLLSGAPGVANTENTIFEQAALQGESVFSASGDAGSDDCAVSAAPTAQPLGVDDPGSQPFVTSVGGTTITDATNPTHEQVWNDGTSGGGGGGGVSQIWGAPSWQQPFLDKTSAAAAVTTAGLTPCANSPGNASACREVPDVSAQADEYTGAITVYSGAYGGWGTFGGTSSSAPLWAAMIADVNASSGCSPTSPVGFVSPELYAVAAVPAAYQASFNDLTLGNNDVYDVANRADYATKAGYDMASGLGSPKIATPSGGAGLAAHLCALAGAGTTRPAISAISPAVIDGSTTGALTITGTGLAGAKAVSVGNFDVPAADWAAISSTVLTVAPIPTALQAGNGGLAGPQDGTGRAVVSVTGSTGTSSLVGHAATVMYVKSATSSVPVVSGVSVWGGPQAGANKVTVFGSGFVSPGVSGVTIGGVSASGFTIVSPDELSVTIPAYAPGTTDCVGTQNPATDVCQVQVVVSNVNGDSDISPIRPPYAGVPFEGGSDGTAVPSCEAALTCEIAPANSEYDYYAAPVVSSITTTSVGDPTAWVSEKGTTIATVDGTGFDPFSVNWINVGPPDDPNSQVFDILTVTPTQIQVVIPRHDATVEPVSRNLTVQTLAGRSSPALVRYAGVPVVSSLTPPAGPDTGGTPISVQGQGFQGIDPTDGGRLSFQSSYGTGSADVYSGYHAVSDTSLKAVTPQANPGSSFLTVCTVTGCSFPRSEHTFIDSSFEFFRLGDPVVTATTTKRGPAAGGTRVVITGRNLSDVVEVWFGNRLADAHNTAQVLSDGSSTTIDAVAPPGVAGSNVNIVVETVESLVQGRPSPRTTAATFAYAASVASPPRHVTARSSHTTVKVHWATPLSNGGHAITKYRVRAVAVADHAHPHVKRPPAVSMTTSATSRSARLKHLRGGWTYIVGVVALNAKGSSGAAIAPRALSITDPA